MLSKEYIIRNFGHEPCVFECETLLSPILNPYVGRNNADLIARCLSDLRDVVRRLPEKQIVIDIAETIWGLAYQDMMPSQYKQQLFATVLALPYQDLNLN